MRSRLIVPSLVAVIAFGLGAAARADDTGAEAPAAPAVSDADRAKWGDHMGDLPFVVGAESGGKAAAASGRTPMYFFTATW